MPVHRNMFRIELFVCVQEWSQYKQRNSDMTINESRTDRQTDTHTSRWTERETVRSTPWLWQSGQVLMPRLSMSSQRWLTHIYNRHTTRLRTSTSTDESYSSEAGKIQQNYRICVNVCLFLGFFTAQQHTRAIIVPNKLLSEYNI
jgi:hypothetical protein